MSLSVNLSVIIDGRLDVVRARQIATVVHRLGLAGAWVRHPWWSSPARTDDETASLLAGLAADGPAPAGLIVDAGAADDGWLNRETISRIALAGDRADVERWRSSLARRSIAHVALPDGTFVPCSPGRDLTGEIAAARAAAGLPVLAEVTVSVGRTAAEARARADADPLLFALAGHPIRQGLFGTLEECQATAARLAQAGAAELACYLPLAADLHDVLAQLRSIAIGASLLTPGQAPSAAPSPPAGWGGRRPAG